MPEPIVISPATRIEGHARIVLEMEDASQVRSAHLQVHEIRGFEKLLCGMELTKMPQITARICGVCPAAHHLAAVVAIERGLGVNPPAAAQRLRNLLYAGHILHSHALSTFVLSGPDVVLGLDAPAEQRNVFHLLQLDPDLSRTVLRLRSIGQRVVETVGGRGVHPVTAVPGGMASCPDSATMSRIAGWGEEANELLTSLLPVFTDKLTALTELRTPSHVEHRSLALMDGDAPGLLSGELVVMDADGSRVSSFPPEAYAEHLAEHVMAGSYMKAVRFRDNGRMIVGPLARLNIADRLGTQQADHALSRFHDGGRPRLSAVDFVEARLIEMVHCAELIAGLAAQGAEDTPIRTDTDPPGEGRYIGIVEAPRGVLVHDYTADANGTVTAANLIVATQNNYDAIDRAVSGLAQHLMPTGNDNLIMNGVEFGLRCFDPCLACATHTAGRMPLQVAIQRDGVVLRSIRREVTP
jgi:F420-non-reducing hydrogenase large subunit